MSKPFERKAKVQWPWMGGVIDGQVEEIFFESVTRILKGKNIKRNGSAENPAYLVRSKAGNFAMKLHSELFIAVKSVRPKFAKLKVKPTFEVEE